MAFPTIPTQANGRLAFVNQLDTVATLTGPNLNALTGRAAGDLVIAIAGEYQSNAGADAAFTGWAGGGLTWTEIRDSTGTANGRLGVAYARLVTGTETGLVTVTRSGTLVGDASMILLAIPGAHAATAPEASTAVHATAAAADVGVFDPAGWVVEDTLWIGVNGNGLTNATGSWTANNSAPANYTDFFGTNPTDTSTVGDFGLAVAFRQLSAASEDMGTFGQDTSNARSSALIIAVRPAPSLAPVNPVMGPVHLGLVIQEAPSRIVGGLFAGEVGVTGTVAVTQDDQTSAISGTVTAPAVTGTIAVTQEDQTSNITGVLEYSGTIAVTGLTPVDIYDAGDTATPPTDIVDAGDTATPPVDVIDSGEVQGWQWSTITGTVTAPAAITGTIAVTQEDQTSTISGTISVEEVIGTKPVVVTQVARQSAQSRRRRANVVFIDVGPADLLAISGTVAVIQEDQTSTIAGTVTGPAAVTGTIAATQADQTSAISGTSTPPPITGTIAATQDDQTSAISGTVIALVTGTIAVTQDNQTGALAGWITVTGTIAVTQANQTSTISGTFTGLVPDIGWPVIVVEEPKAVTVSDPIQSVLVVDPDPNVLVDDPDQTVMVSDLTKTVLVTDPGQTVSV